MFENAICLQTSGAGRGCERVIKKREEKKTIGNANTLPKLGKRIR